MLGEHIPVEFIEIVEMRIDHPAAVIPEFFGGEQFLGYEVVLLPHRFKHRFCL
jgi:hypothetical protein